MRKFTVIPVAALLYLACAHDLSLAADQSASEPAPHVHQHHPGMDMRAPVVPVPPAAPGGDAATDHSSMDHSKMDHSSMDHSTMDYSKMDHSKMDHSTMDHSTMDHSKMDHSAMGHAMPDMAPMTGMLGAYAMTREASGTSWQPDASPHDGMHVMAGDWSLMVHGYANAVYDRQSGPRGNTKTFSQSMLMLMGQRRLGPGMLGLRAMGSFDPLMGKGGYPELFQTGETGDGVTPLIDRQHPHDLVMELAATYSLPLSADSAVFAYLGLPGEPALGPTAFMHRFSGVDNPEAPITHHWLDSTHISYGVATLGFILGNVKLEASAFRGREPDQFRYNIETGRLDSHSARLTWNPTPNWSGQVSYGRLKSPEALEPTVDVNRTTASVTNSTPFNGNLWQTTFAVGRNAPSRGSATTGYLLESALTLGQSDTLFARAERVDKNELFVTGQALAGQSFKVNKASLGYVHDFITEGHYRVGLGGVVSAYSVPAALDSAYGSSPHSAMVFVRVKLQ